MTDEKKKELAEPGDFAEAPASVNTRIKSPKGFEYQFTLRDEKASNLMFKIAAMEEKWLGLGYTPVVGGSGFKSNFNAPQVPTQECPVHHFMMKEKPSKTLGGAPYYSHARGVYGTPTFDICYGKGFKTDLQGNSQSIPDRQMNQDW